MRPLSQLSAAIACCVVAGCASLLGADFDRNATPPVESDGGAEGRADGSIADPVSDAGPGFPIREAGVASDGQVVSGDACATCTIPTPSNAAAFGALPTSGATLTLPIAALFDTSADCQGTGTLLGSCNVSAQTGGAEACVCRMESISIQNLTVTGPRPLVLLAHTTVKITGLLDVAATRADGGPGSEPATASKNHGCYDYGNAEIVPLRGGESGDDYSGKGGGGGGALQISAGTTITIAAGAIVQAGGGGGVSAPYTGGGGGTGGGVLLEAPLVKVDGDVLANGGGGGGGGDQDGLSGGNGQNARDAGRNPASGGYGRDGEGCALSGYTSGGGGGHGGTRTVDASAGEYGDMRACVPNRYVASGAEGGSIGRIRINTDVGDTSLVFGQNAYTSPLASWGTMAFTNP